MKALLKIFIVMSAILPGMARAAEHAGQPLDLTAHWVGLFAIVIFVLAYLLEGVGKKMIPGNVNFDLIDRFIKVDDKNSAFRARQLAKREGIFAGYSSGAAIQGVVQLRRLLKPEHIVVVLLPDHGSKYMSKIYNDGWMQRQGFIRSLSKYANSYKIQKRLEKVITKYVKYGSV